MRGTYVHPNTSPSQPHQRKNNTHENSFGPKKKEKWEMTAREKVTEALKLKDAATGLFKVR